MIVWLRKDPSSAIKLIEALADEFRMINQISTLKLIPIGQEIDLCRAHLKIMSYRKVLIINWKQLILMKRILFHQ